VRKMVETINQLDHSVPDPSPSVLMSESGHLLLGVVKLEETALEQIREVVRQVLLEVLSR
jgi:hypothetical protein